MGPSLMRIPLELRLMIYDYLFDVGEAITDVSSEQGCSMLPGKQIHKTAKVKTISIRHEDTNNVFPYGSAGRERAGGSGRRESQAAEDDSTKGRIRTQYYVTQRSFHRNYVETTYCLANRGAYFCTALMRTNSAIYAETRTLLYAGHIFDFGADVEAVKPFFSDLEVDTRALVQRISLYKRGPWLFDNWSDRCEWRAMCKYLHAQASVQHLRLVVQAGHPRPHAWKERELNTGRAWIWDEETGEVTPRELSRDDVALLVDIRHDMLDWVGDIIRLKNVNLRDVEVVPHFCHMPPPQTSNMLVFLAFSASVENGFREYLRDRLGLDC